jgi:hypothetical protein
MASLIQRITVITKAADDRRVTREVYRARPKRRPRWGRKIEKLRRRRILAHQSYWTELLQQHDKANRKRTFGSVLWRGRITAKAMKRAMRTFRRGGKGG